MRRKPIADSRLRRMATADGRMQHSRVKLSPLSDGGSDSDYKPPVAKFGGRQGNRKNSVQTETKVPPLLLRWDGYIYKNDGVAKNGRSSYWHCQKNNKRGGTVFKCKGRVVVKEGELQVTEEHCHEPDTLESNYVPPHSQVLEMRGRGVDHDMWAAMKGFVSPTDKLLLHKCNPRLSKKHHCSVCRLDFALARVYEVHRMLEHNVLPAWRCEDCGMQFIHGTSYKVHIATCHGIKPYTCNADGCDAAFSKKVDLKSHVKSQHPTVNFSNNLSASSSTSPVTKEEVGGEEEEDRLDAKGKPIFKCHFCPAQYPHACRLRYHMRFHTGERPFKCPNCSLSFFTSSSRLSHIRQSHLRIRRHLCDLCGKKFKDVRGLRQHTLTHTGEKNYVCSICSRRFSKKNSMVVHMRQHTGEKPHVCDQCGQAFTVRVSLRTHLKSKHNIIVDTSSYQRKEVDPGDNSLPAIGRPKREESEKQLSVKARARLEEDSNQQDSSQSNSVNRTSRLAKMLHSCDSAAFSASNPLVASDKKSEPFSLPDGGLIPVSQSELYEARWPAFPSGLRLLEMMGNGHSVSDTPSQIPLKPISTQCLQLILPLP